MPADRDDRISHIAGMYPEKLYPSCAIHKLEHLYGRTMTECFAPAVRWLLVIAGSGSKAALCHEHYKHVLSHPYVYGHAQDCGGV